MKKYCLLSTYYCNNCNEPSKIDLKYKFNYDGNIEDIFINFHNFFDAWNIGSIPNVGVSKRKDLVYAKIFLLKDYIKTYLLNNYEFICHIDYSDVKFHRSFIHMMQDFENSGLDFIMATEKKCWPYYETVSSWGSFNIENQEFTFLNSGALISKTNILYEYLNQLVDICLKSNIDFWDDQGAWQYYHLKYKPINLDYNCNYFFCTGLLDDSYFHIIDNKIITKFSTHPYIIHDNSSFSLNLIRLF